MTEFGRINADGTYEKVRVISQQDLLRCPHVILDANHYRADGSCKCSNAEERARMIREWDYSESDFAGVPVID